MPRHWEHVREIHVGERSTESAAWIDDQTTAAWTPQHVRFVFWPPREQAERASTDHLQAALADVVAAAEARARRTPTGPRQYVPSTAIPARAPRQPAPRAVLFGLATLVAGFLAVMSSRALVAWLWSPMQESSASSVLHDLSRSGVAAAQAPAGLLPSAAPRVTAPAGSMPQPTAAGRAATVPKSSTAMAARRGQRARARVPALPPSAANVAVAPPAADEVDPTPDASAVTDLNFMDTPISAREARAIADGRARMGTSALNQPAPVSASTAFGTLRINSRPWALLFIDGRYVGNTPQLGLRLRPGQHSVRLVNTVFGMSRVFTVELGAGETLTRIEALGDDTPPVTRSSTFQGNSETQTDLPLQLMP